MSPLSTAMAMLFFFRLIIASRCDVNSYQMYSQGLVWGMSYALNQSGLVSAYP